MCRWKLLPKPLSFYRQPHLQVCSPAIVQRDIPLTRAWHGSAMPGQEAGTYFYPNYLPRYLYKIAGKKTFTNTLFGA